MGGAWNSRVEILLLLICSFFELPTEAPCAVATSRSHTTRWKTGFLLFQYLHLSAAALVCHQKSPKLEKKSDSMPERTNLEEFLLSKHRVDMKNDNDTSHGWQTI